MSIDDFIALVPVGSENGLKIEYLASRAGMTTRAARDMISEVNTSGKAIIINLSDRKGYFIAGDNEKHLERLYAAQEGKRFVSMKDKLEGMNRYLGKAKPPKQESELDRMQINLSQFGIG